MTARTVLNTATLETFRTTFNSLSTTDIGDPAALTTTATNLVGAINEVSSGIYSGFTIVDSVKFTHPVKKIGLRPLLRYFTNRYYLVYAIKNPKNKSQIPKKSI